VDRVAVFTPVDRQALFRETAARMGIASAVITEKDFWVCWTLKGLFGLAAPPSLLFKGGTSLSKAFGLIDRFSEDIDLSFNRADLGFGGEKDPILIRGTKARRRKIEALAAACRSAVCDRVHPALEARFRDVLGDENWSLEIAERADGQVDLQFHYPISLEAGDYGRLEYIRPMVRLEIGARSDHHPSERLKIRSFAAEQFPEQFAEVSCEVVTLAPERTFWEKATILHNEYHRPVREGEQPAAWKQMSRHCYDLAMMAKRGMAERALGRMDLLEQVAHHKKAFYYTGWSHYDEATTGALHLSPSGALGAALRGDYAEMQPMFFGDPPSFDEILAILADLEGRVNLRRSG
jgi:hypothetical protein